MQAVCDVLEQLVREGTLRHYAIGGATAAGFHGEPLAVEWDDHRIRVIRPEHLAAIALTVGRPKDRARLVYLVELPGFDRMLFADILSRHCLQNRWDEWAKPLGLEN